MKKALITLLIFILTALWTVSDASMVIMDYQGDTVVHPYGIERALLLNSDDGRNFDIAVRPLDECVSRNDGKVQIPLENFYINNNTEDVYMRFNEYSYLFKNIVMGGVPQNITARIKDYGMVPSGVYNMMLEVQAIDSQTQAVVFNTNFNLQFIVPVIQSMSFHNVKPRIMVGAENAFAKNKKVASETAPMLYINSNTDWVLTLNTDNLDTTVGNFYVRTVSASSNVNERLQERVLLLPNKDIVIAKGTAPSNNEFVSIEYSIESKDGKIFPAGSYHNRFRYRLSEDRGK